MKRIVSTLVALATTAAFAAKVPATSNISIKDQDRQGTASFVTGDLGQLSSSKNLAAGASMESAAKTFLMSRKDILPLTGGEDFNLAASSRDSLGQAHYKFQQTINGLPVVGAEYIVHTDANGKVLAMNGRFVADKAVSHYPATDGTNATEIAVKQMGIKNASIVERPTLTYVVNEKSTLFLAWTTVVKYVDATGPQEDRIFANAENGDLVAKDPHNKYAKSRKVYTANNRTTLPGTLLWSEGGTATSDTTAQAAYNYAGNVYDFYKNVFGRDSYDNAGATIISSVHYSTSYNNAFWNSSQMVYGDGDGTQFAPLSKALDVDAHELTHAVTERTANLNYTNESGALNEGTSDILGNSCEAYSKNGGTPNANTWMVGEDITTPGTSGDALRYMNNPTSDGYSADYYPERLTGSADNGGVHGNSGIANLAYYLMVMGGHHPRNKTTITVTPLSTTSSTSLDMAQRIWYRALTTYWTSSTGFSAARTGTVQAATDLYGAAAAAVVTSAWDCVGAPGGTGGGGGGGTTTTLSNGVAVTGLSGATGASANYKITVPAGQTSLVVAMSGGTGDADLYIKKGSAPTTSSYDQRGYLSGNNETLTVTSPVAADYYVLIYGYAAYSGVTLKATYSTTGGGGGTCTTYTGTLSGTGAIAYVTSSTGFTSAAGSITGALTGPSGKDFDLYLQKLSGTSTWTNVASSEGSTATENISYTAAAGTYRFKISSYSGSGAYSLCAKHP